MEQRTWEWFEARKGRITASSVGAILGHAPYATRDDVMRRMVREYHGAPEEFEGNIATEYGTRNEAGALTEPLACCVKVVNEMLRVGAGDVALLTGPGPIGLLAAQVLRARGALVLMIGKPGDEERLAVAQRLGVEEANNPELSELERAVAPEVVLERIEETTEETG